MRKQLQDATPTNLLHSVGGVYTAERVAVHNRILGEVLSPEALARATPPDGSAPTFVVLGGRGGAGKSWFVKSVDSPISDPGRFLYLNNDDFKASLPEYQGWNAGMLHEEASDLASRAHSIARQAGVNVIFDATLRSQSALSQIDAYKDAGYQVEGYFMHTAPHVSAVRAAKRFVDSGRWVPPKYILTSTTNEQSFDSMTPHFDEWAVYDNNTSSAPVRVVGGTR